MKKLIYFLILLVTFSCNSTNEVAKKEASKTAFNDVVIRGFLKDRISDLETLVSETMETQNQILVEIEKIKNSSGNSNNGNNEEITYTYPTQVDINSITWTNDPYTPNPTYSGSNTAPAYRVPFADPVTGAIITRIGDQTAFGTTGQGVGHNYSSTLVWNSDASYIMLNTSPAHILNDNGNYNDPTNYDIAFTCNPPSGARWSFLDPIKTFGTQNGNQFVSHNVVTDARTVLETFTGYTNLSIGAGEGKQDRNDQYIALQGTKSGTKWIIVYDIINDTYDELDLGSSAGDLDSSTVSPLGNYVILTWKADGTTAEKGFQMYDIDLTNVRSLYAFSQHDDFGIDVNGDEVLITLVADQNLWDANIYVVMVRLSDQFVQPIFQDNDGGIWGTHISCNNFLRDGYVYISENLASDEVAANMLFALPLVYDGSNLIEPYGTHHTDRTVSYLHEAKLSVSPNGTKMCVDSNWFNTLHKSWTAAPSYIFEWLQD